MAQHFDRELLRAALVGYEAQLVQLQAKAAEVSKQLGSIGKGILQNSFGQSSGRRRLSAAARKRIGAAQKKRWAAFHAETGKAPKAKPVAVKKRGGQRKLSAAGRAAIVAALKKRWAAKKAAAA